MAKVTPTAAKNDVVAPNTGAQPGTEDTAAEKVQKIDYPGLKNEKGEDVKLKGGVPDDFDPKIHNSLKRKDFEDESQWFIMQAERCEAKAKSYREEAAEWKRLGSTQDRARAKKLLNMQKKFDALKEQLAAQGVDVDELLAGQGDE